MTQPADTTMTLQPSSPDRRLLLQTAGALCGSALLAACARQPGGASPATQTAGSLDVLLDGWTEELLTEAPHEATALGLDVGSRAALRGRWPDRSVDAAPRQSRRYTAALNRLAGVPRAALNTQAAATLEAARFTLTRAQEGAAFAYGDQGVMATLAQECTPYVINQMIGLALSGPQFLATQHPLRTADDVASWLERLGKLPAQIDNETERFRRDAALGVVAPRFILATLASQLDGLVTAAPERSPLLDALAPVAAARERAAALDLLQRQLLPAVQRQRDAVRAAMPTASEEAGVRRLPDGERYYAWSLQVGTTTGLSAEQVHRMGLAQAAEIAARMEPLLRGQGLTQGGIGERLRALGERAEHRFANTDAGRQQAIAYCNEWVARLRAAMPRWSGLALRAPLTVKRVPAETEAGAPGAYMAPGALDGSRDAAFYLNLRDTAVWPRWTLPTLVVHETLPGHVWQEAHEAEIAQRHPVRSLLKFNGYSEGWGLYAEHLVDEAGFYADDPLARLGYLQAQQLRATRLVVDTGLHAFGWSRERAMKTLADATGRSAAAVQNEIDRYCVKPGQACGYKIGQAELLRLRQGWLARHAAPDAMAAFNDAVLRAGNLPLPVLQWVLNS
ncbi:MULTISPECIES: DUF885 family protein [unclassified Roseateles]|uniref:DUF885 domain-containing protein n=1 Tax=unclassified Roseateles TaxID=2626991 RepID=UPI00138EDD48|nr:MULTISPECIES: DUF885 family protein [unclassified Roseateles]